MTRRLMLLTLVIALTGCGIFSRSKSRFYSFERVPPAAGVTNIGGAAIGIEVVELPPGFDRSDVVVRKPDNQVEVRGTEQWTASVEPMVLHTLAFNLADRLPEGMVILPGQAKPNAPMRSIDLIVEDFAAGPEARVILDARWKLRENGRPELTQHEVIEIAIPNLESESVANGMSQALGVLADRIVARLARQ